MPHVACDTITSLTSYNSSEKKPGLTEPTVLLWQFLKFDLTLLINFIFQPKKTAHLQFTSLISTTPPPPPFSGVSSIISSFHYLNALIISFSLPYCVPLSSDAEHFFYFRNVQVKPEPQPHKAQWTDLKFPHLISTTNISSHHTFLLRGSDICDSRED